MKALIQLHLRQALSGRSRWALLGGMLVPILLTVLLCASVNTEREHAGISAIALYVFFAFALSALPSLLFGTAILGAEVQDKTAVYLFTRAVSRSKIVIAKYLANVALVGAAALSSLTVAWAFVGRGDVDLLLGVGAAVVGGVIAYNAVFALIGAIFSGRPLWTGFVWLAIFEILIGVVPTFAQTFTVSFATRGLAFEIAGDRGLPEAVRRTIAGSSVEYSILLISITTGAALLLTCWIATNREYRLTDNA